MFSTFCPFFSLSISFSFSLAFLLFRSPMRPMVGSSLHLLPMPCTKGAHVCSLHSRHRSHSHAKALATESRSHQPAPPAIASSRAVMLAGGGKLVEKEGGGGGWSSEQPPRCCLPATRPPPRHQARHQHIPTSVYLCTYFYTCFTLYFIQCQPMLLPQHLFQLHIIVSCPGQLNR